MYLSSWFLGVRSLGMTEGPLPRGLISLQSRCQPSLCVQLDWGRTTRMTSSSLPEFSDCKWATGIDYKLVQKGRKDSRAWLIEGRVRVCLLPSFSLGTQIVTWWVILLVRDGSGLILMAKVLRLWHLKHSSSYACHRHFTAKCSHSDVFFSLNETYLFCYLY